jgi:HTH-type transcriptional regulator/antitoxin HigA
LVKQFPLRPIRTDDELDKASEIFSQLGMKGRNRSQDENDYLDVLEGLIIDYEAKSPAIQSMLAGAASIPPQQILRSIIEENGLSQSELAREIGTHQGHISAFLSGKRALSKLTAVRLAKRFSVSVELFLPRPEDKMAG